MAVWTLEGAGEPVMAPTSLAAADHLEGGHATQVAN